MKFSNIEQDLVTTHYLNPGEFEFSDSACYMKTILGSCVAITLWHPYLHIGGMCHFVLPERTSAHDLDNEDFDGRYCAGALRLFEWETRKRNTELSSYHAKMFGGGDMVVRKDKLAGDLIGDKNIEAAIKALALNNIPLIASDTGGACYRCIVFDVASGDVWVRSGPQTSSQLDELREK